MRCTNTACIAQGCIPQQASLLLWWTERRWSGRSNQLRRLQRQRYLLPLPLHLSLLLPLPLPLQHSGLSLPQRQALSSHHQRLAAPGCLPVLILAVPLLVLLLWGQCLGRKHAKQRASNR